MSKRAYRATRVNDVNWDQLAQGKDGLDIALGVDVGKYALGRFVDGPMVSSNVLGESRTPGRYPRCSPC